MKQKITLTTSTTLHQFQVPTPWRIWCHICNQGFMSIAEEQEHWNYRDQVHRKREDLPSVKKQALAQKQIINVSVPTGSTPVIPIDYGPGCAKCGTIMERAGSCYTCPDCGDTSGCS